MINDIRIQSFRSYKDDTFEFGNGVNIIVGPNASGKTNLLESILTISLGGSYRVPAKDLVMFSKEWARLDAHADNGQRLIKFEHGPLGFRKTYDIGGQIYKRLPMSKKIPLVLFEPEHLRLLSGSPERRRDYLDDILEQLAPGFSSTRSSYQRTLQQRNALLKKGMLAGSSQLFAWNIRLSELGGQVAQARHDLTEKIADQLGQIYDELAGSKLDIGLKYEGLGPIAGYSSQMLSRLESSMQLDYLRGFTSYGPHRDDMKLLVGGRPAGDVASRGEIRTLLLCLKIVELRLLESSRGQKPLLLLDDVFSELDGHRRRTLTNFLKDHQTFITTTDADVVVQHFINNCTIIPTTRT